MIYFDHAATSPLLPEVREKMKALLDLDLGNASALHAAGRQAQWFIEEAREEVAKLINAKPEEIIFTSGGSESNNTVINVFDGKFMAVSSIEHPSILEAAKAHAKRLDILRVDRWGRVAPERIPTNVDLVSVMLANNELGTLEPIKDIAARYKIVNPGGKSAKKQRKTYVHTDATQALGKIAIDVKNLGVEYMTISAHKIGGPLGVGALYVKKGAPFKPLIYGGHQENKRRAGTSNVLGIAGFGAAAKYVREHKTYRQYFEKIHPLRNELKWRILQEVPHSSINSPDEGTLFNILNMSFMAAEGESIQLYLDEAGIEVSTGSACAAGDIQPSHVIMATKNDAEVAHSSIRFSLGLDATLADVDKVLQVLPGIITKLQGISTIKVSEPVQTKKPKSQIKAKAPAQPAAKVKTTVKTQSKSGVKNVKS